MSDEEIADKIIENIHNKKPRGFFRRFFLSETDELIKAFDLYHSAIIAHIKYCSVTSIVEKFLNVCDELMSIELCDRDLKNIQRSFALLVTVLIFEKSCFERQDCAIKTYPDRIKATSILILKISF